MSTDHKHPTEYEGIPLPFISPNPVLGCYCFFKILVITISCYTKHLLRKESNSEYKKMFLNLYRYSMGALQELL